MSTKMTKRFLASCMALVLLAISCDLLNKDNEILADNVIKVETSIAANTTWLDGKVYYIVDDIVVENGATLTIQAGAVVKFKSECSLNTYAGGTINATGTQDKPIYFTSILDTAQGGDSILNDGNTAPAPGSWQSVWIDSGSNSNKFIYCRFMYAGSNGKPALSMRGQAQIDHCVFAENLCGVQPWSSADYAALYIENATNVTVTNNLFYHNRWPLSIPSNLSIDATNSFSYDHDNNAGTQALSNTYQGICVKRYDMAGTISWNETEVPYCIFEDIVIDTGATFTIADSAIIKMLNNEIEIYTGGTFNRGTAIFTSYKDDTHGGDTNADGTASQANTGDWIGIYNGNGSGSWITDAQHILYATDHP